MQKTSINQSLACMAILFACFAPRAQAAAPAELATAPVNQTAQGFQVKAFLYGDRTVIDWGNGPAIVSITDQDGDPLPYDRQGEYYRLDPPFENFVIYTATQKLSFVKLKLGSAELLAAPPAAPTTVATQLPQAVYPTPTPAPVERPSSAIVQTSAAALPTAHAQAPALPAGDYKRVMAAEVEQMRSDLRDLKAALKQAAGDPNADRQKLHAVVDRINDIQGKLATSSAKITTLVFDPDRTQLTKDLPALKAIIPAAKEAERIQIRGYQLKTHGYTEADLDSPKFLKVAQERADSVRKYLIGNGVPAEKISVSALAIDGFDSINSTPEGRARSRRVEVEFVESELRRQAMATASR